MRKLFVSLVVVASIAMAGTAQARPGWPTPPQGPWIAGGMEEFGAYLGHPYLRLEGGLPLGGNLALQLPLLFSQERYGFYDPFSGIADEYRFTSLMFVPGVQQEWAFAERNGHHFILGWEAGGGIHMFSYRYPDYYGNNAGVEFGGIIRGAGVVRFLASFGLQVSIAPVGAAIVFGAGGADGAYDFSLTIGYRFGARSGGGAPAPAATAPAAY